MSNALLGVDLTNTPNQVTDASFERDGHRVGQTHVDHRGYVYICARAEGAITQYMAAAIDENYDAVSLTKALADAGNKIGIAQATMADEDTGWFLIKGQGPLLVLASCAADVALFTSASAGYLDDGTASQTKINGVVLTASKSTDAGTANAYCTIEPWVQV